MGGAERLLLLVPDRLLLGATDPLGVPPQPLPGPRCAAAGITTLSPYAYDSRGMRATARPHTATATTINRRPSYLSTARVWRKEPESAMNENGEMNECSPCTGGLPLAGRQTFARSVETSKPRLPCLECRPPLRPVRIPNSNPPKRSECPPLLGEGTAGNRPSNKPSLRYPNLYGDQLHKDSRKFCL